MTAHATDADDGLIAIERRVGQDPFELADLAAAIDLTAEIVAFYPHLSKRSVEPRGALQRGGKLREVQTNGRAFQATVQRHGARYIVSARLQPAQGTTADPARTITRTAAGTRCIAGGFAPLVLR